MASLMLGKTRGVSYKLEHLIGHLYLQLKLKKDWRFNSIPPYIIPGVMFKKLREGQIYLGIVLFNRINFLLPSSHHMKTIKPDYTVVTRITF
jgi:hypothetical protein